MTNLTIPLIFLITLENVFSRMSVNLLSRLSTFRKDQVQLLQYHRFQVNSLQCPRTLQFQTHQLLYTRWHQALHRRLSLQCIHHKIQVHLHVNTGPIMEFSLYHLIVYYVVYSFAKWKMHNTEQYILVWFIYYLPSLRVEETINLSWDFPTFNVQAYSPL